MPAPLHHAASQRGPPPPLFFATRGRIRKTATKGAHGGNGHLLAPFRLFALLSGPSRPSIVKFWEGR